MINQTIVEKFIGLKDYEVAMVGDSAGGNMVCSLTNWIIANGLRKPKGLVLNYPGEMISAQFGHGYFYSQLFVLNARLFAQF